MAPQNKAPGDRAAEREKALAAALRANLRRRKAGEQPPADPPAPEDRREG